MGDYDILSSSHERKFDNERKEADVIQNQWFINYPLIKSFINKIDKIL